MNTEPGNGKRSCSITSIQGVGTGHYRDTTGTCPSLDRDRANASQCQCDSFGWSGGAFRLRTCVDRSLSFQGEDKMANQMTREAFSRLSARRMEYGRWPDVERQEPDQRKRLTLMNKRTQGDPERSGCSWE
jgi:hypothetical protein